MSISTVLMKALAAPLAKLLLKRYLADPGEAVGEGLLDVVQRRIEDYSEQREAQRQFERLGERIVARLVPLFEQETGGADIGIPAVGTELAETLGGRISAEFFLTRDLDPARLAAELRGARPVHKGPFSAAEIALYNRALDEAVRYVVQVASHLPKFEEAYASVSLQRLGRMTDDLEEVLDTTRRIERTVGELVTASTSATERSTRYEADYRQAVMRNLDYLELFGADISPESRRHTLSVAYISLNLKRSSGDRDEPGSLPVEAVLDSLHPEEGRLLIRGEAGSGKSTLSRWTAIQAASLDLSSLTAGLALEDQVTLTSIPLAGLRAKGPWSAPGTAPAREHGTGKDLLNGLQGRSRRLDEVQQRLSSNWRLRIPFLIRLRDCKDGQLPSPDDIPTHIANEIGSPPPDWVASILRQGRGLVLLDGVDEVPNVHRDQLRRAIESIVRAYPNNYYIASTRPTAVEEGWLAGAEFREAAVDPMSDVDRTLFIEKWHDAVGRELARLGRPDATLPQIASELIEHLPDHPPVARLATNPLLCAMICALHRERSQKLPESQAELCEAVCQMLLHRRERESGLSMDTFPEAYRALTYPEKRAIVQDIAHYMVRNGASTIAWEQARQSVVESLKRFPDQKGLDPNESLKLLIERSGALRETRPGEIDFIHNTLKEYLAAERFVDAGDAGQLADRFADASWRPVILFSVATNRREFASEVVRRILHVDRRGNLDAEELRARHLFALRCRAAALHLSPQLIAKLDAVKGSLFPPRSDMDAEALASSGDAAVDYLRWHKGLSDTQAAACVRTLRLIGTPKAEKALRSYFKDDRWNVVSELAKAVNPLEIDDVRTRLESGHPIPAGFRAQITDLAPLRGLDLRSLNLGDARIADLAPLAGLTRLQTLILWNTQTRDLAPLAELRSLQSLDLMGTQVTDLKPLRGLTNLHTLDLGRTQVSDLSPLAGLTGLRSLNLSETPVKELTPLARLTGLQSLSFIDTQVRDLAPLAGLRSLQSLSLAETSVSDLTPLAALHDLILLDLSRTPVRDLAPIVRLNCARIIVSKEVDTSMLEGKPGLVVDRVHE
jgi:hypothetical protein